MALFQDLRESQGITIIFVTHEPDIAQHTRRIIHIRDGQITSDEPVRDYRAAIRTPSPNGRHAAIDGA